MTRLGVPAFMVASVLFCAWAITSACSHTPAPAAPKSETVIRDRLSCFLVESQGGNGLVCTERPSACDTIQGATVLADGVTAISECKLVNVTVDVPKE